MLICHGFCPFEGHLRIQLIKPGSIKAQQYVSTSIALPPFGFINIMNKVLMCLLIKIEMRHRDTKAVEGTLLHMLSVPAPSSSGDYSCPTSALGVPGGLGELNASLAPHLAFCSFILFLQAVLPLEMHTKQTRHKSSVCSRQDSVLQASPGLPMSLFSEEFNIWLSLLLTLQSSAFDLPDS